jgi:hypothetical protein
MSACDHFWRTVELSGYGWINVCDCGYNESAEHSDECLEVLVNIPPGPCICGAQQEYEEFLKVKA